MSAGKILNLTPFQFLSLGFLFFVLAGSTLLSLPISSAAGDYQSFIDSFFMVTSAITTTGLVVVDVGSFYSLFGQILLLIFIQIGGLGYMIFFALIVMGFGKRLSFGGKILLRESMSYPETMDMLKFSRIVILFTAIIEIIGSVVLSVYWIYFNPINSPIYSAIFHSISAFNTAGFSTFYDSIMSFRYSILINTVLGILTIAGAIGFFVLYDLYMLCKKKIIGEYPRILSTHSKFVLTLTFALIFGGTAIIFLAENGLSFSNFLQKVLTSSFQAITASTTTGFNSINIGAIIPLGLLTIIFLMFVGSSPGGTGGGIKTTTFGSLLAFIVYMVTSKDEVVIFKKRIISSVINKAFAIFLISAFLVIVVIGILMVTEKFSFLELMFETVSAFGTVGLSMGITPELSVIGKALVSFTMLVGRIGPLAIGFTLIGRSRPSPIKHAEAVLLVG